MLIITTRIPVGVAGAAPRSPCDAPLHAASASNAALHRIPLRERGLLEPPPVVIVEDRPRICRYCSAKQQLEQRQMTAKSTPQPVRLGRVEPAEPGQRLARVLAHPRP